ncbi:uncharacterized protein LOC126835409 isoform X2 [Adelges cooleyi]|nr:uncharacterized protein LOC126835409 isoform X2 [Adelges cooleyi]
MDMPYVMKHVFGIDNHRQFFIDNPDKAHYKNNSKLFLALAYHGTFESFEDKILTPFEAEFYLRMFMKHIEQVKQDGYLTRDQLAGVLESLYNIKGDEKSRIIESCSDKIYAAEFLSIMLENLPEGNGLNKAQIEEFIGLYRFHQNEYGCIQPSQIYNIFQEFNMANEPLKGFFYPNRPAAKVLMELMIVTAERSKKVNNDEIVLSTKEVRSLISEFTILDTDKDGILSNNEAENFLKGFLSKNLEVPTTFHFNVTKINVAEYLLCYIYKKVFILNFYKQLFSY